MAVGQIIGRVSVKVMPHTKDFRREAERALTRIERSLEVDARVTIDPSRLKVEALKAVRELNQQLRADAYKVKFHATIDRSTMADAITKARKGLEDKARAEKIRFDTDVAALLVDAELDSGSLRKVKEELEHWRDDISPLTVGVRPEVVNGTPALVAARLEILTRPRTVPIVPVMDKGAAARVATALAALSGGRVLVDTFDDLWNSLKRLDKSVPIIGSLALAVLGLSGYGLSAASNLFALSQSLAQIGPAALALPGIFGGLAIGLGATVAVFKDFNKVLPEVADKFHVLQDQMSEKFWTVAEQPIRRLINSLLPELSAGLQKTSTELGGFFAKFANGLEGQFNGALAGMFTDLSASIAVAGDHTDSFAQILRILGEVGAGYLPRLAGWFGDIADQFSGWLDEVQQDGRLVGWIDQGIVQLKALGRSISNLSSLLSGIAKAADAAGGSSLTMMADTLGRAADVVNGATFQKNLTGVLLAAHEAMGNIANESGPAFEKFMLSLSKVLQTNLPVAGQAIGELGKALFSALSQDEVATGFTNMIAGIAAGVSGLAPAFAPVGKALGSIMSLVGALASNLGPLLGAAFSALGPAVSVVAEALVPVVNMLGPILTDVVTALAPVVAVLGKKLAEIAVAAQPLIERIGALIRLLLPVLVPVLKLVANILGNAIIGAINGAIKVFDGIKQAAQGFVTLFQGILAIFQGDFSAGFGMVWDGIKAIFFGAFEALVGALQVWLNVGILSFFRGAITKMLGVWQGGWATVSTVGRNAMNAIKSVLQSSLQVVLRVWSTIWRAVVTVFRGVWTIIRGVIKTVTSLLRGDISGAMAGIRTIISGALGVIKGIWGGAWNLLKTLLKAAFNAMKTAVTTSLSGVMTLIKSIPGKIMGIFSGAGTLLLDVGGKIIDGLKKGLDKGFEKVKQTLKKLTDLIPDWKGPRERDKNLLYAAGQTIITGLVRGLTSRFDVVRKALQGLTKVIPKDASKSLTKYLEQAQSALLKHLKQWDHVRDRLAGAKQALQDLRKEAREYATQVAEAIIATGDITKGEDLSFEGIITSLQDAVEAARRFAIVLRALKNMGLNEDSFAQIVAAGPTAGLAAAESILAAGAAGIDQINDLQSQLAATASDIGKTARAVMYDNGIAMAEGLVAGLQKEAAAIEKQMLTIATAMVNTIKKALGIHSPSRVFAALGAFVARGFQKGIASQQEGVSSAIAALASVNEQRALLDTGKGVINGLLDGMESRYSVVKKSLSRFGDDIAGTDISVPVVNDGALALANKVNRAIVGAPSDSAGETKVLNYYAAPGSSLSDEDDLFGALDRARSIGF